MLAMTITPIAVAPSTMLGLVLTPPVNQVMLPMATMLVGVPMTDFTTIALSSVVIIASSGARP
eukprot:9468882-Lingulodinium_polyedra.AAC.1